MVLLLSLALYGGWWVARRFAWPGTERVAAWFARTWPKARAVVVAAPATFTYLFVLTVTTWVLLGLDPQTVELLHRENSTNLYQLGRDPLRVLVRSAFWVNSYELLVLALLFAAVLAPAERWLGTARWIAVFAAGHVGATLLVALGLSWAIRWGWVSPGERFAVDVGASYGLLAVAAVFSYRLPGRRGWWWAGTLVVLTAAAAAVFRTFTDAGHLVATAIGFAAYPVTRAAAVRARRAGPVWRAWASG